MMSLLLLEEHYADFCRTVAWTGLRYTDREKRVRVRPIGKNMPRLKLAQELALFLRDMILDQQSAGDVVEKTQVDADGFITVESRKSQKSLDPDMKESALIERMRNLILMLYGPGENDKIAAAVAKKIKHDEAYVQDSIARFRNYSDRYGNANFDTIITLLEMQCGRRYAT